MYIRVLEFKHSVSEEANKKYEEMQRSITNHTSSSKLIEDHVYAWEHWTKTAMMCLPHARFENVAILALSGRPCTSEYLNQFISFVMIMVVIWLTENYAIVVSKVKSILKGEFSANAQARSNMPEEFELSDSMLSGESDDGSSYPKKRHHTKHSNENASILRKATPVIRFENMTKDYNGFLAVDQLNLSLYKNEVFCFLGHNGAGKTTSLNVLIGRMDPSQGTIKIRIAG